MSTNVYILFLFDQLTNPYTTSTERFSKLISECNSPRAKGFSLSNTLKGCHSLAQGGVRPLERPYLPWAINISPLQGFAHTRQERLPACCVSNLQGEVLLKGENEAIVELMGWQWGDI